MEVHCHWRNDRTIDWCKQEGVHVTAYAPLSSPQTMRKEGKDVPNLLKVLCCLLSLACCQRPTNGIAGHMRWSQLDFQKEGVCFGSKTNRSAPASSYLADCGSVVPVHIYNPRHTYNYVTVNMLIHITYHMYSIAEIQNSEAHT